MQITALSTASIAGLTTAQVASLATGTVAALSTAQVAALSTAQVTALDPADIGALSPAQIAAISSKAFAGLETADIATLTPAQISAVTSSQIPFLSLAEIVAFSSNQIAALSPTTFVALTTQQIASIEAADIPGITTAQIELLTCVAHRSFTASQVAAFSTTQLHALNFSTPLVLDIDGDGLQTISMSHGVVFDVFATGTALWTGWVGPNDAFLAIDRNKNGVIDDGGELFGSGTHLHNGTRAANGFIALKESDSNNDNTINAQDDNFDNLLLWFDKNQDGISQHDEIKSITEYGFLQLHLQARETEIIDQGNVIGLLSSFLTETGQERLLADVWLAIQGDHESEIIDDVILTAINDVLDTYF